LITTAELKKLSVPEKRQIVGALLQNAFDTPRSFPLSYSQEQLWFMDKLQPGSPVYNIPLYVPFRGSFDLAALEHSLRTLIARHDMLRARFDAVNGEPRQIIEPEVPMELPIEDLSKLSSAQRSESLGRLLNREVQQPFDLSAGACVRYRLFRLQSTHHLLSATMHHIITDAWSLGVFVSELRALYHSYRSGQKTVPLAPLALEYSDYARWQRTTLRGLRLSNLLNYWTAKLKGAPHVLPLPTDHPRPADQTFNGTVMGFVFPPELSEGVIALSRERKLTPFMVLLACYYILLYRYTGQEDIVVGAPVANRAQPELEPIIGLFVNTVILRMNVQESDTFSEFLRRVQQTSLEAFEHQALPFDKLVDALHVERVPGYPPLYQVVFNFQNASLIASDDPHAEAELMKEGDFPFAHSNTAKVDLNLTVTQNESVISGGIEYNTDLFEPATVQGMIAHYQAVVEAVVSDPSVAIIEIPLSVDSPRNVAAHQAVNGKAGSLVDLSGGDFNFEMDA
jgi:non-ribosomal peptide synthetase component F